MMWFIFNLNTISNNDVSKINNNVQVSNTSTNNNIQYSNTNNNIQNNSNTANNFVNNKLKGVVKLAKDVKMFYIESDIKKIQTKTNLYIQKY